jgi:hypothetical protein
MTDQAALAATAFVILRKGLDLTGAVAHQAILAVFDRVRYHRYLQQRLNLVAHEAGIICPAFVIIRKGDEFARPVARQAVLPLLHRVRDRWNVLQEREAISQRAC